MQKVLACARQCGKPVVVHFLGAEDHSLEYEGVIPARSLRHAAEVAVATLEGKKAPQETNTRDSLLAKVREKIGTMAAVQKDVRGVFAGGTFCYEAQLALLAAGVHCESNAPVNGASALRHSGQGVGHSLVDMGDDEFTQGRPHPMIDPALRNARLLSEGRDPATAVLLFDIVLGYGASPEPCATLLPVLETLQHDAAEQQRTLLLIAHVCGTEDDPQDRQQQIACLQQAGVLVADSNIEAARLAAFVAQQRK